MDVRIECKEVTKKPKKVKYVRKQWPKVHGVWFGCAHNPRLYRVLRTMPEWGVPYVRAGRQG